MSELLTVKVQGWMVDEAGSLIGAEGGEEVVEECLRRIIELEETRLMLDAVWDLAARDEAVQAWLDSYPAKPGPILSPLDNPDLDLDMT